MKKLLSSILSLAIVLCLCATPVSAGQPDLPDVEYEYFTRASMPPRLNQPALQKKSAFNSLDPAIVDVIYNAISNNMDELIIYDYNLSDEEAQAYVHFVFYNYPELFNLSNFGVGYVTEDGQTKAYILVFWYYMDASEYSEALKAYNNALDNIISGMDPDFTDLEKMVYVHDYLASNFEYDTTDDEDFRIYDAYQFLTEGTGVCQAYMLTFLALMQRLDVYCIPAYSDIGNHTWNIVMLDGEYYHLDVTSDDPIGNLIGVAQHDYFLVSSQTLKNNDIDNNKNNLHEEWYVDFGVAQPVCDSGKYESGYVWDSAETSLVYSGGEWYYMDYDYSSYKPVLYAADRDFLTRTQISQLNFNWPATGGSFWLGYFGSVFSYGTLICFIEPQSIGYYDTVTETFGTLQDFSYDNDVYGAIYDGHGYITLETRLSPNDWPGEYYSVMAAGFRDADGDGNTSAVEIILARKYILTGHADFNWGVLDVAGGIGIDLRDLIRLKKYIVGIGN